MFRLRVLNQFLNLRLLAPADTSMMSRSGISALKHVPSEEYLDTVCLDSLPVALLRSPKADQYRCKWKAGDHYTIFH